MTRPTRASPRRKPRTRRDAESARVAILDAAERRLVSAGPAGIRLQEVARDAGMSHPTVLHHFGSREALVAAVVGRTLAAIKARLIEAAQSATANEEDIAAMLDGVFAALTSSGHGRVLLWVALEGTLVEEESVSLTDVVTALDAMRLASAPASEHTREDTAHAVVLAALALTASTVLGPALLKRAGLPDDAAAQARFRKWLAQLLTGHLRSA